MRNTALRNTALRHTTLLAALLLAAPAFAQTWTLQPEASSLGFVAQLQGAPVNGAFERFDAAITLDPAAPQAGSVTITVDIASARTDNDQANQALATADWFAADQFGQAVFASDSITGGDGRYVAEGTLTIRDQAQPVTLPFTLTVEGTDARAAGTLQLDRTAFGIGQGNWAGASPVAHEVEVSFDIAATAQ